MTANQVTLTRIALLPVPCVMLLFGDPAWHWAAFFFMLVLGATDFIDGLLARRDGPTKLGGLLDPVADKIMMAAITLVFSGNHWIPVWVSVAILSREFGVTILRSLVALREHAVRTSILAKVKTIIQMGGFGVVFMTLFLEPSVAIGVSVFWFVFFMFIGGYYTLVKRDSAPYWAFPVAGCFLYWFLLLNFTSQEQTVLWVCLVIVGITWLSALDYLKTSLSIFKSLSLADLARLFWVAVYGVWIVLVISLNPPLIVPVLISIAFELALGGIDNIAISEGKILSPRIFLCTSIAACAVVLIQTQWAAVLLIFVSAACCFWASRAVKWRFF